MSKRIGITELAKRYSEKYACTIKEAKSNIEQTVYAIHDALVDGESISFTGEFTLEVKERAERIARNPNTKEEIICPASKSIHAKIGSNLKKDLNS